MYAFVQDVAASWEQYEHVTDGLLEPSPGGLVVHLAGPTDEGFRIIGLWESRHAWEQFQRDRLQPAIAALGGPTRPEPRFRDVEATHVVFGEIAARFVAHAGQQGLRGVVEQIGNGGRRPFEGGHESASRTSKPRP